MFERFNGNVVPFADESTSTNRTVFGSETQSDDIDDNLNADFKKGWEIVGLNDNPTREDFNAMGYTLGYLTSYLYQNGVAEYNLLQEYKTNSIAIGTDGNIYQSLVDNNIGNSLTDTTKWVCIASKNSIVNSIAELKTISNIESINVLGYYEKGDGGGGTFYWDETSTETDNGGTIIQATGITTGRWKRVFSGAVNVKWFDVKQEVNTTNLTNNATIFKYMLENFENIEIIDFDFSIGNFVSTAIKTKVLKLANSKLTLDGGNIDLTLSGNLVIDLLDGGIINGGLRYAILSVDAAVGTTVIPVEVGHTFRVGDRVTNGNSGDESFPDADRGNPAYKPNYITAISTNTITIQNEVGDYTGTPLFKNWYITNALFDKGGIILRGVGKVNILGGRIEDSSGGYWVTTRDNIEVETFSTEFYGQGLDGFYMGESSSIIHNDTYIHKSYGTAKQLVAFYSSKDFVINGGKVNRGNYDVDFYMVGSNCGKVIANNCTFDGKNTLLIAPEQISSFTGLPITSVYNYIGDALHSYTIVNGGAISSYKGFEANDCKFINYQRSISGTTFTFAPTALQTILDIKFNNCELCCSPFYTTNNANIVVNNILLNDLEIDSLEYYPTGYGTESTRAKIKYSGKTIIDNKNRTDNHVIVGDFDSLTVKGGGTFRLGSNENRVIEQLTIIDTYCSGTLAKARKQEPIINLIGSGSVQTSAFSNSTDYIKDLILPVNNTVWYDIAPIPVGETSTVLFKIDFIPFKLYGSTRTFAGSAIAWIPIDGTEHYITMPTFGYSSLTYPVAKWNTSVLGASWLVGDTSIKLRVVSGQIQVGILGFAYEVAIKTKTTALNKKY